MHNEIIPELRNSVRCVSHKFASRVQIINPFVIHFLNTLK